MPLGLDSFMASAWDRAISAACTVSLRARTSGNLTEKCSIVRIRRAHSSLTADNSGDPACPPAQAAFQASLYAFQYRREWPRKDRASQNRAPIRNTQRPPCNRLETLAQVLNHSSKFRERLRQ